VAVVEGGKLRKKSRMQVLSAGHLAGKKMGGLT